jgi:hypothetical protein
MKFKKYNFFLLIIFCYSLFFYFYHGIFQARSGRKTDFDPYYTGAYCIKNNVSPYNKKQLLDSAKNLKSYKNINSINKCVYPPFYMHVLKPFLILDIKYARIIWSCIINFLLIFIILFFVYRLEQNIDFIIIFSILLFLFNPLYITIALGQVNLLILFLIFAVFYFYKKNNKIMLSICLACATLIKIIPAIFYILFLLKKKFRLFFYSLTILIIIFLVSYFSAQKFYNQYFFEVLPQFAKGAGGSNPYNISVYALLDNFKFNIIIISYLFKICVSVILIYKTVKSNNIDFLFGLYVISSLLVINTLWEHHLLLLIFPVYLFLKQYDKYRNLSIVIFIISYSLIALNMKYYDIRLNEFPLLFFRYIKFYGLILFYICYLKQKQIDYEE